MILNVNRILHTPGASQDFHFEMDLSDLEFGGERPVVHPVAVDGRVYNQAGVLLCELQASTTLRCVCDRCMEEFDSPKTASFSCILAEEKQDQENDDIVLLDHDEVDLADLAETVDLVVMVVMVVIWITPDSRQYRDDSLWDCVRSQLLPITQTLPLRSPTHSAIMESLTWQFMR